MLLKRLLVEISVHA